MALSTEPSASTDFVIASSNIEPPRNDSPGGDPYGRTAASETGGDGTAVLPPKDFLIRTISALALSGGLILCLYFGWPFFHLLVLAAAGLMAWEWAGLCGRGTIGAAGRILIVACLLIVVLASFGLYIEASMVLVAAGPLVALSAGDRGFGDSVWFGVGVLYVGGATWGSIALFDLYRDGVWAVVWIFIIVAFSDIGAFLVGRTVGGPKLAPRISPKKTWSGFFGGLAASLLAGMVFALVLDRAAVGFHMGAALVTSFVAQAGDLFESHLKRHFGAKDSGRLIPGHGGLLDRVDGVVPAMLLIAVIAWFRGGVETPWL